MGPLNGYTVIELAGIGPAPMGGMVLADMGAEVIRMLKLLVGEAAFRAGMDLYFERCDGTAATIEDFLGCFAETSGHDLTHFARWYEQAGTPTIVASNRP